MRSSDLYGSPIASLEAAKDILESVLAIRFKLHEHESRGGDYYRFASSEDETFILQLNIFDDGEPYELAFPEYPIILYVEGTERSAVIQALLSAEADSFKLLKHEEY